MSVARSSNPDWTRRGVPGDSSNLMKRLIVDHLSRRPCTLAGLQAETHASIPTIRRALEDLTRSGWVTVVGHKASTGGRRATLYGLNAASHVVIGVHIELPGIHMILMALDGTILDETHVTASATGLPDQVVGFIVDYANAMRGRFASRHLLGIGTTAPGYLDMTTGKVLYVGRAPGWQNYPLKLRLETAARVPVVMENDSDCLLRAELDSSENGYEGDILYLAVLEGVKLSILLNGQIYSGPFRNAGLIGRTKACWQTRGETCDDLEARASVGAVCSAFDDEYRALQPSARLANIASLSDHSAKFAAILEAAAADEPLCARIIHRVLSDLALAVANAIFILQPPNLLIGGELGNLPAPLRARFDAAIRDNLPALLRNYLTIHYARHIGRTAVAVGAAQCFLKRGTALEDAVNSPFQTLPLIELGNAAHE